MPVISPYGNPQDCGSLQVAPLQHPVARRPAEAATREINMRGAYIHVIFRSSWAGGSSNLIREQLPKLSERTIPTPATMLGVGFHRLYNHDHWSGASGLVFNPESTSLISYKGSIGSYRLSGLPRLPMDDPAAQSQTLRQVFNQLGNTVSMLQPMRPRKLRLTEDVVLAAKKYDELAHRVTAPYHPLSGAQHAFDDVSSKFIIARYVAQHKPAEQWRKAELLTALADTARHAAHKPPGLSQRLGHAQMKIEKFGDDSAVQNYLRKGAAVPNKVNVYRNLITRDGVLPPNEHLLMPSMNDVLSVYVDLDSAGGIDHAFLVLNEIGKDPASSACGMYPAMSYRLSQKKNRHSDASLDKGAASTDHGGTAGFCQNRNHGQWRQAHCA